MVAAVAVACGPSVQGLHESNVRFEHCYRLDLDPSIAPSHRAACWREWSESYTTGQTDDRIDYARRRVGLAASESEAPKLDLDAGAATPAASVTAYSAPVAPTAAVGSAAPSAGAPSAPPALPALPGAECAAECASGLRRCSEPCSASAADACKACPADYRKCMRRCFK